MGEKGPNKFEREQIRKRNQQARDEYDWSHIGNYKLVYPVLNNPVGFSGGFKLFVYRKRLQGLSRT
jgi:hypothetical protein